MCIHLTFVKMLLNCFLGVVLVITVVVAIVLYHTNDRFNKKIIFLSATIIAAILTSHPLNVMYFMFQCINHMNNHH